MSTPAALRFLIRHSLLALGYTLVGFIIGAITLVYYYTEQLPDLRPWHTITPAPELHGAEREHIHTLTQYLAMEEALFDDLERRVYAPLAPADTSILSRYHKNGQLDPTSYRSNWNRTRELPVDQPAAGFLLLHGLSDSPYSLRQLALTLQQQGGWVVALRLPGHGTVPAALQSVSAADFKYAVRLGARHLREKIGPRAPLYIVGYSNGATLAVEYVLSQLEGESLPRVDGLVLLSPAIGVTDIAALAPWQQRLAHLPGLEKLAWHAIQPEYDPYKYNSFPLNAAAQIYALTTAINHRLDAMSTADRARFPPITAYVSAVDATVSVTALVDRLLVKLPTGRNRLVVYDINRRALSAYLSAPTAEPMTRRLLGGGLPFAVTVLTNENPQSTRLVQLASAADSHAISRTPTQLHWPQGIYSLSHVALPIAPDDPLYGSGVVGTTQRESLGNIALRGERGLLQIPESQLMRLRYNPFYRFQQRDVLRAVGLASDNSALEAR